MNRCRPHFLCIEKWGNISILIYISPADLAGFAPSVAILSPIFSEPMNIF